MRVLGILVLLTLLVPRPASALGAVSRACNFLAIAESTSVGFAAAAAELFESIGTAPLRSFSQNVIGMPKQSLARYWVLESITADYAMARYALAAETRVYRLRAGSIYGNQVYDKWAEYRSGWAITTLPTEITTFDRFRNLFSFNRSTPGFILYSARAGHSDIFQRIEPGNFSINALPHVLQVSSFAGYTPNYGYANYSDYFMVFGNHYYRNGAGVVGVLQNTSSVGCNPTNLAFGIGDR